MRLNVDTDGGNDYYENSWWHDYLMANAIAVPNQCSLCGLGVWSNPGIVSYVALYTSSGDAPNQLVTQVSGTASATGNFVNPVSPTTLPAGIYWFA